MRCEACRVQGRPPCHACYRPLYSNTPDSNDELVIRSLPETHLNHAEQGVLITRGNKNAGVWQVCCKMCTNTRIYVWPTKHKQIGNILDRTNNMQGPSLSHAKLSSVEWQLRLKPPLTSLMSSSRIQKRPNHLCPARPFPLYPTTRSPLWIASHSTFTPLQGHKRVCRCSNWLQ